MKKRIVSCVLIGAMSAALFSGCGKEEKKTAETKQSVIRITYAVGELDGKNKDLDLVFENFYKEHPGVEVVTEENGSALMAKIAANDAPDIIRVNSVQTLPTYVNKKVIIPIDDMLKKSELYDEKDIYEACRKTFTYDGRDFGKGHIYGLPKDWSATLMWVNKKMFTEAGLEVPTMENPMTYDEMAEYAKKLTKKSGNKIEVFGLSNQDYPHVIIESMLNEQGYSMYSKDFKKINLKDENVRKAFKYVYDLKVNGYMQSPLYPMGGNGNPEFATGKCAMNSFGVYSGSVYISNPDRTVAFEDMAICPTPVVNKGDDLTISASPVGGVISTNAKDLDLVFDLWEFIHLGELAKKRADKGFNLPISRTIAQNAKIENDFQRGVFETGMKFAEKEPSLMRTNPYVTTEGVSGVFEKYFTPLLYGQYKFDEALDLIESEIQILIDEGIENA